MKRDMIAITDLVTRLYITRPVLRDDSRSLLAHVWLSRLSDLGFDLEKESSYDLLKFLATNKDMPKHESVSRCGRKLQELRPELRGKKWTERHALQQDVVKELNEIEEKMYEYN
jgi:hypothetical protein